MFKTLFEFIEKHVDKTVILIVVCMLFGAGALYHIDEIVVTEKAFAGEVNRIYDMMQKKYDQSKWELKISERNTNLRFLQREKDSLIQQKSAEQRHLDYLDAEILRIKNLSEKEDWKEKIKRTNYRINKLDEKISIAEKRIYQLQNLPLK